MDEAALLDCIEWAGHGFEIVHSIFPGWRFSAADCVAAQGLHGAFLLGPRQDIDRNPDWLRALSAFEITLLRNGAPVGRGHATDVLDGPLSALRHLVALLADDQCNPPLAAGEIITTGSVTKAFPIVAGERWNTEIEGLPLVGISLLFA
jgi:2-oxo-3-hexenedioate decarboxylase